MPVRRFVGWVVVGILALTGCQDEFSVKTVPVSGKVTIGGQPAVGVNVHFLHEKATGYAKTDATGAFKLVQGAVSGENRVYFSLLDDGKFNKPDEGMDAGQFQAMAHSALPGSASSRQLESGQKIPPEYSDPAKTQLKFTVPGGGSDSANFDLPKS